MANAVTRYTPEQLPVLHGRVQPPELRQSFTTDEHAEALRAEPPRTEVRFSSRFDPRGAAAPRQASDNDANFSALQLAQDAAALQLTARKPRVAGYGAYAATAQLTDAERPRPGQKLDVSV